MSNKNIDKIAMLYRDLLSSNMHPLNDNDKSLLLSLKPYNKIIAIGDIDFSNWNVYPLTYFLENKLYAPTVLDESKIYQSMHAMRTHDETIIHPQLLISQCVVIRIIGLDNSANVNEYINSFISMCIAADECKIIFVIFDGDKKYYKNNIYTRKTNSSFIDINSADKSPYKIESAPLCIPIENIVYFNYSKSNKQSSIKATNSSHNSTITKKNSCVSMLNDPDIF